MPPSVRSVRDVGSRRRRRRGVPLALVLAGIVVAATACLPTSPTLYRGARFHDCKILYYDATGTMRPYLDEVTSFTGMRFIPASAAAADGGGLTIGWLRGGPANLEGTTQASKIAPDSSGRTVVYASIIRLRPGASPGIHRHELGHLFDLAHDPSSPLMRPAPDPWAGYSSIERRTMRQMVERSSCERPVSFSGGSGATTVTYGGATRRPAQG